MLIYNMSRRNIYIYIYTYVVYRYDDKTKGMELGAPRGVRLEDGTRYVYVYTYIYIYVYVSIYIYMYREREREREIYI